jgi:hypothetical protein
MTRMISFLLLVGFCLAGCATDQPARKGGEGTVTQVKLSPGDESTTAQLRSLESSVSQLRSEVIDLGERVKRIQAHPPLTVYKLPEAVSICGEKVPLEDRKVWEILDQEIFPLY